MNKIVACIDGSQSTTSVCSTAAWCTERLKTPLELLHVLDKTESPAESDLTGSIGLGSRESLLKELAELDNQRSRLMLEQGRLLLEHAKGLVEAEGVTDIKSTQRHDNLLETLKELEDDTRLLIMGRRGQTNEQNLNAIGTHLENVIRTSCRPILMTLPGFKPPKRFMLAYDGSPTSEKALGMVAVSPLLKGIECHLVTAGNLTDKQVAQLNDAKTTLERASFDVTVARLGEDVVAGLLNYSEENKMDMLVMGAYGHSRIRQFLVGSITTLMLHKTEIPLLLLR